MLPRQSANPFHFIYPQNEVLFRYSKKYFFSKFQGNMVGRRRFEIEFTQPAFTCSKLTMETLEQDVKYAQS